jgi:hypothetical protein
MLDPIKTPAAERLGKAKEANIELDPSLLAVQFLAAWHGMASIWEKKQSEEKQSDEKQLEEKQLEKKQSEYHGGNQSSVQCA